MYRSRYADTCRRREERREERGERREERAKEDRYIGVLP